MIKEFQKVRLKTGEEAVIIEILQKGRAFLADVKKAELDYETDEITMDDIAGVFVETEHPLEKILEFA
ncbi:MAG: hypothetical protein LBE35_11195 [Clostridiales bacterium]|jgi:hypothetical protein|nr:hypothetical protein [Clostridiales bacterium]